MLADHVALVLVVSTIAALTVKLVVEWMAEETLKLVAFCSEPKKAADSSCKLSKCCLVKLDMVGMTGLFIR